MRPTGANANHQNHLLRRTGRHILLLGLLMIVVQTGCASRSDARFLALQKKLQTRLTGESGTYAVALRDLQTGEQLLIEPYRGMHAASTMKTAVMVEVFRAPNAARRRWMTRFRCTIDFAACLISRSFLSTSIPPPAIRPPNASAKR